MGALGTARSVVGNRDVLAAEAAYTAFAIVVHGAWLAGLVFAFNRGGVSEAGIVAFVVMIPGVFLAPFLSVLTNRLRGDHALAIGLLAQAMACGATGTAMLVEAHAVLIYGSLAALMALQTVTLPTLLTVLPGLVKGPAELAAANATLGLTERIGSFFGPMVAASILYGTSAATVFLVAAGLLVMATGLATTLRVRAEDDDWDEPSAGSGFADVGDGLKLLKDDPSTRLLVILLAAILIIFGALDVALVAIAVEQLGRDEATVGLLAGAIGVGGIVGAGLTFLLVGRRRLTMPITFGLLAVAIPIMALASTTSLVLVMTLLAVTGLGRPVLEVAGRTLIQGLSAEDTMAGIFGLLEGLTLLAVAVGALGFSIAVNLLGLAPALLIFGGILPLFLGVQYAHLRRIDEARPEVDAELLELMRSVPIFSPLPAFQVEQLLVNMNPVDFTADTPVFSEGDQGDLLYVVTDGSAMIELVDGDVETERGGFFGEIALIRNQPRMATVRAGGQGLQAYTLDRDTFISAISGVARSKGRTDREIERRLGEAQ
ncbi:MAG: cyclic nucleotide-binding domain-containing protein [Acidimicrobiales bacterium]